MKSVPSSNVGPAPPVPEDQPGSRWKSMALSLGLHGLLLVSLILLSLRPQVGAGTAQLRSVDVVLTTLNDQNETEYLTESEATDASDQLADTIDTSPPADSLEPLPPLDSADQPAFELPQFDAAGMTQVPSNNTKSAQSFELSDAEREMIAADRARFAAAANQGSEASLQVFGSGQLSGRKFVFVLDRSKSMGTQGLGVLDKAAEKLSEAVAVLEPHHKFQVIAYHHRTTMISDRTLLKATSENKQSVAGFIGDLAAFGSTQHESALIVALSFRPDIVVFLTDGGLPELNQSQLQNIRRAAGRTQIHCIQFGSGPRQTRGGFMMQLAAENEGSYRYIDVNDWNK